ncbi:MAG: hypothetical protein GF418_07620 [Chitinivibrionales bacterium]|nr:hypothetical protein [Chitinivibrionales bacterium]MBD3395481.1 hypothetical protein [Chitinivibrionales bacterium]
MHLSVPTMGIGWRVPARGAIMLRVFCIAAVLAVVAQRSQLHAQVFRGYSSSGDLEFKSRKDRRREVVKGYYPDGKLEFVATYRKGVLDGDVKEYYQNGMLKAEIRYDDGERDGIAKFYHDNGMLMCKIYYEDDEERRAKFYDRTGLLTTSVDIDRSGVEVRQRNERRRAERKEEAGPVDSQASP